MRGGKKGGVRTDSRKDWLNLGEIVHNIIKPQGGGGSIFGSTDS